MKKEHVAIIKKAIRELGDKEWRVDNGGKIYWNYISKEKPAFQIGVGKEEQDEYGTSTRVCAIELQFDDDRFKFTYAGTDRLLCDYNTVEEAIYAVAQSVVRKAKYLY